MSHLDRENSDMSDLELATQEIESLREEIEELKEYLSGNICVYCWNKMGSVQSEKETSTF